mgnify:CR=1 FL=1
MFFWIEQVFYWVERVHKVDRQTLKVGHKCPMWDIIVSGVRFSYS